MIDCLTDDVTYFPPLEQALTEPDGLLAVGGDLSPNRLIHAYSRGIFPWYSDGDPILWWSPNPRMVLFPEQIKISRSLKKVLKHNRFTITADTCFADVIHACKSKPRPGQDGTWIQPEMVAAYCQLHELGIAHSVEVWDDNKQLVGGLYGIALGTIFFGESMFSHVSNASKIALCALAKQLQEWTYHLIDCQMATPHLSSLGAVCISRTEFQAHLVHCERIGCSWQKSWCIHELE